MIILKPYYYDEFRCIANECTDSCCIGWEIEVDKKSFYKYKQKTGEFGNKLKKNIRRKRKNSTITRYGNIVLKEDGRCTFLNGHNLCDIYLEYGEDGLCATCKQYPRTVNKIQGRYERNLYISCPVVAKMMISSEEPMHFLEVEEEMTPIDKLYVNIKECDKNLETFLWDTRSLIIQIAQLRELPIWKRLVFIMQITKKLQTNVDDERYAEDLLEGLMFYVKNDHSIGLLDQVPNDAEGRNEFIEDWIRFRTEYIINNKEFLNSIDEMHNVMEQYNEAKEMLKLEEEFDKFIADKQYVFEHYIVYSIYSNFMNATWSRNLCEEVIFLGVNYILLKRMLLSRWWVKNKTLSNQDIADVIHALGRGSEHNALIRNKVMSYINELDLILFEKMFTWIR